MNTAVIYARFSSAKQREESIEAQVRECKAYAARKNLDVIGVYADHGISGTTDDRPDFQRMIEDSKKKQFKYVILYGIDRFARDRYIAAIYKYELKKNGVTLLYAKNDIPDSPEGVILESVMEGYAEYYSKNLSRNTSRGMLQNAMKGKYNGGKLPLGYKIIDSYYVIDEITAPIVKRIFQDYAAGKTFREIQKEYRPLLPEELKDGQLRSMLTNEKYMGVYTYGDERFNTIPPIVDEELFKAVQKNVQATAHKRTRKYAKEDYILSGKLYCGNCGSLMTGESGRSGNGQLHYYYKCSAKKHNKAACTTRGVRKDWLESFILNEIKSTYLTNETIKYIAGKVVEFVKAETEKNTLNQPVQARLQALEKEMNYTLDKCIKTQNDALYDKYVELKEQSEYLRETEKYEEYIAPNLTEDMIRFWLTKFREGDFDDFHFQRTLINALINKIIYYSKEKIVILYNICDNDEGKSITCSTNDLEGHQLDISRTIYILSDHICMVSYRNELV